MCKKSVLKKPFDKQHGKRFKHCLNLHDSTFIIFIENYEAIWVGKNLS